LEFGNRIVTTIMQTSSVLKILIKLPQAVVAHLQEMRPLGLANCGRPLDHFSDCDSRLGFSERVRSASKNLKLFVQVGKRVRFGSQSGAVCRKIGDGAGATLRGFDSIMF
jgi:hypothetical protein